MIFSTLQFHVAIKNNGQNVLLSPLDLTKDNQSVFMTMTVDVWLDITAIADNTGSNIFHEFLRKRIINRSIKNWKQTFKTTYLRSHHIRWL